MQRGLLNNISVINMALVCLISIFSLFAVLYNYSDLSTFTSFKNSINIAFIWYFLALFFMFYIFTLSKIKYFSVLSIGIGIFAGIINVLGRNFLLYNSLDFFYINRLFALAFSLLAAIGYSLFFSSVFEMGWHYLKKTETKKERCFSVFNNISYIIFDKRPFLYPFLIICYFWAPYFISFFPGVLQWDAMTALRQYYGLLMWDNRHPIFGVLLMGYVMDIGKYFGSDNLGCTIYVVLQYFLLSLTLAYNFVFFNKWNTNYYTRWCILLFFSIHPVFPTFVMTEVKDVIYYIAVLWLLFFFIDCFENYNKKLLLGITIASMFVCALRKEGICICVLLIAALLFFRSYIYKQWIKIVVSIIIGCVLAVLLSDIVINYYHVKPAPIREALTIPVQQTARYIKYHRKDVTQSEWEDLKLVFGNNVQRIGNYYNPDISDPVKGKMVYNLSEKQMKAYLKVWSAHLFRHPGCYISAIVNQIYGYFYIPKEARYKTGDWKSKNFIKGDGEYTPKINVTDNPKTNSFRNVMIKYISSWPELSLLSYLYHPATYTWLLIFGLSCLIRFRQYRYLFFYCIPLTVLCVCCLSPVNAFIRYSYPIMLSCFILLPLSIKVVQDLE